MDGDEIGLRVHFRKLIHLFAGRVELALLHEGVVEEHPHTERCGAYGHHAGDVPEAHETQRRAHQAEHGLARRHRPLARAHLAVVKRHLPRRCEQERHRVLGDFLDAVGGVVRDDDARLGGGVQVYRVHADAVARDYLAVRHPRHVLSGDGAGVGVQDRFAIGGFRQKFRGRLRLHGDDVGQLSQNLVLDVQRLPDVIGQDDFRLVRHVLPLLLVSMMA